MGRGILWRKKKREFQEIERSKGRLFPFEAKATDMEFLVHRKSTNNGFMQVSCKVLLHGDLNVGKRREWTHDSARSLNIKL